MGQFRIKNIDQGLVDEWVYRLNDEGSQIGDDIDARDANSLAESLIDTQDLVLKTSVLAANAILKSGSGIAERLTLLEGVAGKAGLQDIYQNGSMISILSGQPLVLGAREEVRLDDAGNLSFRPETMRIKGSGVSYLELSNSSVHSTLGNLLIGAMSPGQTLTLQSAGSLEFKDNYLNDTITLSESGQQALDTASQSLVGAINELKSSAFNVSFQAVYDQSNPPKAITTLVNGPITFEDSNPNSLADTFKVIGNQTVTKKLEAKELKIGAGTTISEEGGISTAGVVAAGSGLETSHIDSGIQDLRLTDKRLSILLSDGMISELLTNSESIVGAINEIKGNVDSVGGAQTYFGVEHEAASGRHGVITTKAGLGEDASPRIQVKDQNGNSKCIITGAGNIYASDLNVGGINLLERLLSLDTHLSDDGSSHSAVAAHFSGANPHNVVKSFLGLAGEINMASPDGSIVITPSGGTINIQAKEETDMQDSYGRLAEKEISLETSKGLAFKDSGSDQVILMLRNLGILLNRNLNFEFNGATIDATSDLRIAPTAKLYLTSVEDNVEIAATAPLKTTVIQGVNFSQEGAGSIDETLGESILGALGTVARNHSRVAESTLLTPLSPGQAVIFDQAGLNWLPLSDVHPCNEYSTLWYHSISNTPSVAYKSMNPNDTGAFLTSSISTFDLGEGSEPWEEGQDLYISQKGRAEFSMTDFSQLVSGDRITIDPAGMGKQLTALTTAPVAVAGEFLIQTSSTSDKVNSDETMKNLANVLNNKLFMSLEGEKLDMKGAIDGVSASSVLELSSKLVLGNTVTITPHIDAGGAEVTLTAIANGNSPMWLEFELGRTQEETAKNLAKAISRTSFNGNMERTLDGHRCLAEQQGKSIFLDWFMPGETGEETVVSVSTPDITVFPFTGGSLTVRLYRQDLKGSIIPVETTNSGAFSVSDISMDESESQYMMGRVIESMDRKMRNEKKIKVGRILELSGNYAEVKIG